MQERHHKSIDDATTLDYDRWMMNTPHFHPALLSTRSASQFGLKTLLLACMLFAFAFGLGARHPSLMFYASIAATVAGGITVGCRLLPRTLGHFLLAFAAGLIVVAALNCYALEVTFGAYVYDGIPVMGWPQVFATGQTNFTAPTPLPPPAFHIYQEPYWMAWTPFRFDLYCGLLASSGIAIAAIRPDWISAGKRFEQRRVAAGKLGRWVLSGLELGCRLLALAAIVWWLVWNEFFYDAKLPGFVLNGTALHRVVVGGMAVAAALPIAFPLHYRLRRQESGRPKLPALLMQGIVTAGVACLLGIALLRGARWLGEWQHHYLNLPWTLTLLTISLTLGGSLTIKRRAGAWRKNTIEGDS